MALLVPSGNDAAVTLAQAIGGSQDAFVAMMNRRAAALGLTDTHYATPDGLDAPGQFSSVRDLIALARVAMRLPDFRDIVSHRRATIPPAPGADAPRSLESENDLLDLDPDADGVKTGHTNGAGYALVAHARRRGPRRAALPGDDRRAQRGPARGRRQAAAGLGLRPVRAAHAHPGRARCSARARVRDRPGVSLSLRPSGPLVAPVRLGRSLRATVVAPPEVNGPVAAGAVLGRVVVREGGRVVGPPPAGGRDLRGRAQRRRADQGRLGPAHPVILTVTLNAALDRTLRVPNFQLNLRHRASSSLSLPGGKGVNIARALKRLGQPVIATGLAGGPHRHLDHRAAHRRGDPQRLRADPRRVAHVDRRHRPHQQPPDRDQRGRALGPGGRARRC